MEKRFEDLTLGYQEKIDLSKLIGTNNHPANTFKRMSTPDGSSFVLIYQWANSLAKTYNDREEAFYIDGVNDENKDKAISIFCDVCDSLDNAYSEDNTQTIDMIELVNEVIEKHKTKSM